MQHCHIKGDVINLRWIQFNRPRNDILGCVSISVDNVLIRLLHCDMGVAGKFETQKKSFWLGSLEHK